MDQPETLSLFPDDDAHDDRSERSHTTRRRVLLVLGLAVLTAISLKNGADDPVADAPVGSPPATRQAIAPSPSAAACDRPDPHIWAGASRRSVERWIDDNAESLRRAYAQQGARNRQEQERQQPVMRSARPG